MILQCQKFGKYLQVRRTTSFLSFAVILDVYRSFIHYDDVKMGATASQITSVTIAYSTDYSDADQRKHQSSASLAFVRGIHRGPVKSPHKWPVTRKMLPFHDVIMFQTKLHLLSTASSSGFQSSRELWNLLPLRQYLANFMGIMGMVHTTVYKNEAIFTGFRHGKLS